MGGWIDGSTIRSWKVWIGGGKSIGSASGSISQSGGGLRLDDSGTRQKE